MSFDKKTWRDRQSEYPNRRRLTKEDGSTEIVTVTREEGNILSQGEAFDSQNMNDLEERINDSVETIDDRLDTAEEMLNGTYITYNTSDNHFYATRGDVKKKLGSGEGTATTSQVLSSATFTSEVYNDMVVGTMPDYSTGDKRATKSEQTQTDEYLTIDEGYYKDGRIITSKANAIHCYLVGSVTLKTTKSESKSQTLTVPKAFADLGITSDDFMLVPTASNYSLRFLNQTHDTTKDYNWDKTIYYSNNYTVSYNDGKVTISFASSQSEGAGAQPTGTDWTFTGSVNLNVYIALGGKQ